ncbi:hypothetical protein TNCV_826611 [Trichonephila clavipes]|nr:hypothetical protein TNCV_826611 [Trichonephila clavipes]
MIKSQKYLKKLVSDRRDVYELNIIDRYSVRSDKLENECLASFVAWYEMAKVGLDHMKLLKGNQYVIGIVQSQRLSNNKNLKNLKMKTSTIESK